MFVITTFNTEPEMHNNNTDCLGSGDKCKDASKSNTRKRYNSESKTQRGPSSKRNNTSNTTSNNKRVRNRPKKQPCDNNVTVRSVNPFLVDVTKHKNSSKKPIAIDKNVNNINNNVFLMKPTIMEQGSPRGSNSPNVFMNKSAMYSNRGLRQTDTGGGGCGGGSGGGGGGGCGGGGCGGGGGVNYFIHNPKIQYDRRRNDDCGDEVKTVSGSGAGAGAGAGAAVIHKSIDIKNVEQFPSLMRGSDKPAVVVVEKPANTDNIWTKNKSKLKEMITSTPDADVSRAPVPVTPGTESESASVETTSVVNVYKAKVPTKSLARDNIFLAAFMQRSESVLEDGVDTFVSVDSLDTAYSTPSTSILVDSCDTRYDRFYN